MELQLDSPQTPAQTDRVINADGAASTSFTLHSGDDSNSESSSDETSNHYTFTPKRATKVPRAWERKPATPFAPRTESQKIWKRIPLQDRSGNNTMQVREEKSEVFDARAVKRLRANASLLKAEGDNKGNYINTKWEETSGSAKRKIPRDPHNLIQNTRNSLSPLRRDSTADLLQDALREELPTNLELEAERLERRLDELQRSRLEEEVGLTPISEFTQDENGAKSPRAQVDTVVISCNAGFLPMENQEVCRSTDDVGTFTTSDISTAETDHGSPRNLNEFFTDSVIYDPDETQSESDKDNDRESELTDEHADALLCKAELEICKKSVDHASVDMDFEAQHLQRPTLEHNEISGSAEHHTFESTQISACETASAEAKTPDSEAMQEAAGPMSGTAEMPAGVQQDSTATEAVAAGSDLDHSEPISGVKGDLEKKSYLMPEAAQEQGSNHSTCESSHGSPPVVMQHPVLESHWNDKIAETVTFSVQQSPDAAVDDTAFLHDFLTRARAQKAAKAAVSPEKPTQVVSSPAKGTRQALASLSTNGPSPTKLEPVPLNLEEKAMDEEMTEERMTSPCRRSNRTRLPKPQKVVTTAPSNIPVRRSNGTEFIFLQRTEAQTVALATRANTKRNKGEAVPPKHKLEALASERPQSPTKSPRKRSGRKQVSWDEQLAQACESAVNGEPADTAEVQEEAVESKPKTRKVKRLGTANGTPARKRVMESTTTVLPVPARTLRARAKS